MGWTGYYATHYKGNGSIDRKAECDAYFERSPEVYKILKSSMVGTVYYAAIQKIGKYESVDENGKWTCKPIENPYTFAAVFLTQVNGNEFMYKDMDETVGPFQRDCPASILNLLSPTDDEYSLKWRKGCRENIEKKKDPNALANLPIGAEIKYVNWKGDEIRLVKHRAAYQFKRPFWYDPKRNCYVKRNHLPREYEVVSA